LTQWTVSQRKSPFNLEITFHKTTKNSIRSSIQEKTKRYLT